jgi:hypothetical protein
MNLTDRIRTVRTTALAGAFALGAAAYTATPAAAQQRCTEVRSGGIIGAIKDVVYGPVIARDCNCECTPAQPQRRQRRHRRTTTPTTQSSGASVLRELDPQSGVLNTYRDEHNRITVHYDPQGSHLFIPSVAGSRIELDGGYRGCAGNPRSITYLQDGKITVSELNQYMERMREQGKVAIDGVDAIYACNPHAPRLLISFVPQETEPVAAPQQAPPVNADNYSLNIHIFRPSEGDTLRKHEGEVYTLREMSPTSASFYSSEGAQRINWRIQERNGTQRVNYNQTLQYNPTDGATSGPDPRALTPGNYSIIATIHDVEQHTSADTVNVVVAAAGPIPRDTTPVADKPLNVSVYAGAVSHNGTDTNGDDRRWTNTGSGITAGADVSYRNDQLEARVRGSYTTQSIERRSTNTENSSDFKMNTIDADGMALYTPLGGAGVVVSGRIINESAREENERNEDGPAYNASVSRSTTTAGAGIGYSSAPATITVQAVNRNRDNQPEGMGSATGGQLDVYFRPVRSGPLRNVELDARLTNLRGGETPAGETFTVSEMGGHLTIPYKNVGVRVGYEHVTERAPTVTNYGRLTVAGVVRF